MAEKEWSVRILDYPAPQFAEITELRYRVLHEPFGVVRDDDWNDADPASQHAVAETDDGEVVGYARLLTDAPTASGQIRQVVVSPSWERRGVGSALIQELLSRASDLGLTDVWLNARLTAVPFYEKLGFRVTSGVFRTPRTYLPHVRMDRSL
jgi:N-acetylglutamate synthase-like GNAT family acetyltransferase